MARTYRSESRSEAARRTRHRILDAATALFVERGYTGTTVRAVADRAGVSVPAVEQAFGTKARLLKAVIDVAIAGDDEAVPVLDRSWATEALSAAGAAEFLAAAADVLAATQQRSAGLVLAVFEGAATDPALAELAAELTEQRARTAAWVVDALVRVTSTPAAPDAVDTLWVLMDPAVFDRLVRRRGWSVPRYRDWFAATVERLLIEGEP